MVTVAQGDSLSQPAWSPDGEMIYFSADGIKRVQADGGAAPETVLPVGTNPAVSPDGSRLAFVKDYKKNQPGVFVYEFASKEIIPIDTVTTHPLAPRFSRNGRYLVYESRGTREIIISAADGSRRWTIKDAKPLFHPDWSFDDTYLYARTRGAGQSLYRMRISLENGFRPLGIFERVYRVGAAIRYEPHPLDRRMLLGLIAVDYAGEKNAVFQVIENWDVALARKLQARK